MKMLAVLGFPVTMVLGGVIWYTIRDADPTVSAAVIGGYATITVAAITTTYGRLLDRAKQIEAQHREKWAEIYSKFVKEIMHCMGVDQPANERTPVPLAEMAIVVSDFASSAMTWSSSAVIREFVEWRSISNRQDIDEREKAKALFISLERLLLAMRQDLGHKDEDALSNHAILRMFITDADKFISGERHGIGIQP